MKNAKKILVFVFALVALTLVMSLSIFADEATPCEHEWGASGCAVRNCVKCFAANPDAASAPAHTYGWNIGTRTVDGKEEQIHGCSVCHAEAKLDKVGGNESKNLGIKIYYATTANELSKSGYDVIRLKNGISSGSSHTVNNANVIIDLGGNKFARSGKTRFILYKANKLVNGEVDHSGHYNAIQVYNVGSIEDIKVTISAPLGNNTTGILLQYNASYGSHISLNRVTVDSIRDTKGDLIEGLGLSNHGLEFYNQNNPYLIVGDLTEVKVYSQGQAITINAKEMGTMTDCIFSGDNMGMFIKDQRCDINLVRCQISSKTLAIYVEKITHTDENPISFTFDSATKISSNNSAYYIAATLNENDNFKALTSAVALVDGQLYNSYEAAFAALAASDKEVTKFNLIGDLTLNAPIEINKNVEFSLGGGTIKVPVFNRMEFTEETAPGYTLTAPNGAFVVKNGGALTLTGDQGTLKSNENAIVVEEGGNALIVAGTYVGYNPQDFLSGDSCYSYNAEKDEYTLTSNHTYDNITVNGVFYKPDGDCNSCGYLRGVAEVKSAYYDTIEEAIAAAIETGASVNIAVDIDLPTALVISDVITINLCGRKISVTEDTVGDGVFHVIAGGELTITDTGNGVVDGVGKNNYNIAVWADGGKVVINAGTFTNVDAGDEDHYDLIYVKNGGIVEINGGKFIAQTPKWTINLNDANGGTVSVKGGTFVGYNPAASETENPVANFVADGYCAAPVDGGYVVTTHAWPSEWGKTACLNNCGEVRFATIGETIYATFEEAIDAAQDDDTIVIYAPIEITTNTEYELNDITIASAGDVFVVTSGTLTLSGNFTVNAGTANTGSWCAIWANGGNVVVNGGTYSVGGDSSTTDVNHQNDLVYTKNGGTVTINGGTFIAGEGIWALNQNDKTGGAIVVKGGTFVGFNPANNASEGADTNFVADGYCCAKKADTNNYIVAVHNCVAGEPAEDGSVTYTCANCGETYVINNAAVNGEYFLGTDPVVFNNGVLTAMGGEFSYTYNVTTGMIDTDAGIFFQVINGTIYLRGTSPLHQHTGNDCVADEQADGSVNYICNYCGYVYYTVNNAAVNGEYYLGTDKVVFANGVLSAMGGEFNYTYNVTTGMIDTDAGIFFQVINGTIYFRGSTPLHQHVDGGYITEVTEPTCTDKGYTTYICQFCGPLFTADETEALGHSWTWGTAACQNNCGLVKFATIGETIYATFADAIAAAQAGDTIVIYAPIEITADTTYNFANITINSAGDVFVVTSGTLTLEGDFTVNAGTENKGSWCAIWANGGNVVVNGGTYSVGGDSSTTDVNHQNDLIYTKNGGTVTINGGTFKYTEGVWTLNQNDATGGAIVVYGGTFEGFNPANNASEGANTSFVADGYAVVESNGTYTVVNHIHTEVEIPAVPSYKENGVFYAGTTSGVKCSECNEILVAPVPNDEAFQFKAISLSLSDYINIIYKAQVPAGYEDVYVVFTMIGTDTTVVEYSIDTSNRYCFTFEGVKTQLLCENVSATIYATTSAGQVTAYTYPTYSIKTYCTNQLKKSTVSAEEKTMLSDLLVVGDKAQLYANYKTNELATDGLGDLLCASTYSGVPSSENIQTVSGDKSAIADWKTASLVVNNAMAIKLKVYIAPEELDNVTFNIVMDRSAYGLDNLTYTITKEDLESVGNDQYTFLIDGIRVIEYGAPLTCTISHNGEQIGRTFTYSVNTYIQKNQGDINATGDAEQAFIRALYLYGKAAVAFKNK